MDDIISENPLPPEILEVIRLIGRKWSVVILHELVHEPLSFSQIKDKIEGISASVLSDLLTEFRDHDIIEKRKVSMSPPKSLYFITDFGQVLCNIIESIAEWGASLIEKKQGRVSVNKID